MSCRKKSSVSRWPTRRPCWSEKASTTVSTSPFLTRSSSVAASTLPRSMAIPPKADGARRPVDPRAPNALPVPPFLDALQLALDGSQLLGGALDLRPLEPLPRRDEPVDAGVADHQ